MLAMLLGSGAASAQVVINGNVYGGCEEGIVSQNTRVTVNDGTVVGSVYGGCVGDTTDATGGVVQGNTWVYMNGGTVVRSIYGGGQLGSVGTFTYGAVTYPADDPNNPNVEVQVPTACASGTGVAHVLISGGQVGVKDLALMPFTNSPGDDELGYVFCGSQGLADSIHYPQAIGHGVTDSTYLEISGGLITASAYGGSENGLVLRNTRVEIQGGQIGVGHYIDNSGNHHFDNPYTDEVWDAVIAKVRAGTLTNADIANFHICDAWPYEAPYAVYDIFADETGYDAQGGSTQGSNGHSFFGNVFGGGSGYYPFAPGIWRHNAGRVYGNTTINISGGHILTCVYGGNEITDVDRKCTINMRGGTVGVPLRIDSIQAHPVMNYILGAGMGDSRPMFDTWTDVGTTEVNITGGTVFGSVFGGGEDGHVLGDATVNINEEHGNATIGTWGCSYYDGNVFGGGRGYQGDALPEGAVVGNTYVNIEKGLILGSVYGGGRLASVGILPVDKTINGQPNPQYGVMQPGDDHGITTVNITGGTIGNKYEPLASQAGYDTKGGNVFGGSMGRLTNLDGSINHLWDSLAYVKKTIVNISQESSSVPTIIKGNVYGGCEFGKVHDSTSVNISGGRIGVIAYQKKTGSTDFDTIVHITGGMVFGGGKGYKDNDYREAGIVLGNTHVTLSGGHVYYNVYGGGELASVGLRESYTYTGTFNGASTTFTDYKPVAGTGLATVTVKGGQVGPAPREETGYNIPIGLNGVDGYVFGGGKGVSEDWINLSSTNPHPYSGNYPELADVNNTRVTINMPMPTMPANNATDTINRIWGSTFGGGEDGHVLGNAHTDFINGLMGTKGTTTYDGNIFGGGRNYDNANYNAGRVRCNDSVHMCGGQIYGSIFGGGRLALTGVDVYGNILPDNAEGQGAKYGYTHVKINGGTVGNDTDVQVTLADNTNVTMPFVETWTKSSMGDVYGGGKGSMVGIKNHPVASALLVSLVKNTEVIITDSVAGGNIVSSPKILANVFGGGEVGNVGLFTWTISGENIGDIALVPGTGKAKVTVSGGQIGIDRMQMIPEVVGGTGSDKYDLKYNCDLGHVFGGGEGLVDNPNNYSTINPPISGSGDVHSNKSLLDLMATVGETDVTIGSNTKGSAWVKGSVYGGSLSGHVLGDTKVTVSGGQVGAGKGATEDERYTTGTTEGTLFNPLTTSNAFETSTGDVKSTYALAECEAWPYNKATNYPFSADSILLKGITPTDGKTWFGNVFGGGSGYYPYHIRNHANNGDTAVWNRESGKVYGNATVVITGGHILTSVYGGCETSDVGHFTYNATNGVTFVGVGDGHTGGIVSVTMKGGTLGVPRTFNQIKNHPVTCYLFGGGKGDPRVEFNTWTNVKQATDTVQDCIIYGSVFGGGEDGHVFYDTYVNIREVDATTVIGTTGRSYVDGNVFGGGRGFSGEALTAGVVRGNATMNITGGTMLGSIYGGGRLASVGTNLLPTTNTNYSKMMADGTDGNHGHITINIGNGNGNGSLTQTGNVTIGNDWESITHINFDTISVGGNIYSGGMGRIMQLDDTHINPQWHLSGRVKNTTLNIGQATGKKTTIKGNVYGGGALGTVGGEVTQTTEDHSTHVNIYGGTIWRDVYGGGYGSDNTTQMSTVQASPLIQVSPMQMAARVFGNSTVTVNGGWIKKSIYGGGEMASVGRVADSVRHVQTDDPNSTKDVVHPFYLSWPMDIQYATGFTEGTGKATVNINGGRVGVAGKDYLGPWNLDGKPIYYDNNGVAHEYRLNDNSNDPGGVKDLKKARKDNGDIYGGGKGKAGSTYIVAHLANVRETEININDEITTATPLTYKPYNPYAGVSGISSKINYIIDLLPNLEDFTYGEVDYGTLGCISGAVYGGSEDGHVRDNTHITLDAGLVGHAMYGGGKGKGTYTLQTGTDPNTGDPITVDTTNIISGKTFGNTQVDVNGGYVVRNVFGGGNLASIGKGNYLGFGETTDDANIIALATGSGKATVNINGGTLGMLYPDKPSDVFKDNVPYGSVFGGARGAAHKSTDITKHRYSFVNETEVTIGETEGNNTDPHIHGSVYGGGQDGHVRRTTKVVVNDGEIGVAYGSPSSAHTNMGIPATLDLQHNQDGDIGLDDYNWTERGNVFGGGSGLSTIYEDTIYGTPGFYNPEYHALYAGSVFATTEVEINGGKIHRDVFGGGNLAQVLGYGNTTNTQTVGVNDKVKVTVQSKAQVGVQSDVDGSYQAAGVVAPDSTYRFVYGGNVFGAGRGFASNDFEQYCNVFNTDVTVTSINDNCGVYGDVFGGGENGHVLKDTDVKILAGAKIGVTDNNNGGTTTFDGNVFGGGWGSGEVTVVDDNGTPSNPADDVEEFRIFQHCGRVGGNTNITMSGGTIQGSIFGGGRLALTGVDVNGAPCVTGQAYDSVVGNIHGLATINVSGGSIGNSNGDKLLNGSDESVGDIFGSGKGDVKNYQDVLAGRVANTIITVSGSPFIYGAVFGGGEMAGIGYWHEVSGKQVFYENSGTSVVTIGGSPEIGTDYEYTTEYAGTDPEWTVYDEDDGTLIHTCTGNVFGGSQGDVDPECPHWVSMGRSRRTFVTINGGTIKSSVFGGAEQGAVTDSTKVVINGGTIGTSVTPASGPAYWFGGVYGGGYGSHREDYNAYTNNDSLVSAKYVAGRTYGNVRVDVLGGLVRGDVYGGANYAYIGGYGNSPNGNVQVNIGKEDEEGQPIVGSATILGSVFGSNNHSGTPLGYVNVDVYHTAHRTWEEDDVLYTNYAPILTDTVWSPDMMIANINGTGYFDSIGKQCYAIKEVFAGGNHTSYTPNETRGVRDATVHVHYCENTIEDLYGGSNAADIGTSDVHANDSVIVDGGRFYRVFGGGNGTTTFANVHGTAVTRINAGVIQEVYGGGNHNGIIDDIDLEITHDNAGTCGDFIYDVFGGNNEAEVIGDIVSVINCGDGYQYEFYGGNNTATIYGNVTTNVFGGETAYLFGGSKGSSTVQAHIRQFPSYAEITADTLNHYNNPEIPRKYSATLLEYMGYPNNFNTSLVHTGGNVTLNIFGGTITQAAFGGCDVNGSIDGKITVNVFDAETSCNLYLNNLYGAGRNTDYKPIYDLPEGSTERISPVVNVIHGTVNGNAFGGGQGNLATVEASPVVNIGYASVLADTVSMLRDTIRHHYNTWELPSVYADTVKGNVYGGGMMAQVKGNTNVNMYAGVVGDSIGRIKSQVNPALDSVFYGLYAYELKGGRVFGGGEGSEELKTHGLVTGNATVTMSGGKVYRNVYGGGELSSVGTFTYDTQATDSVVAVASGTGLATVTIKGGEIGPLDGTGQNAYVFGGSRGKVTDDNPNPFIYFSNVGSSVVTVCDSARIYGSIFGGAEDGHIIGDVHVYVQGSSKDTIPVIGTNAKTSWDGNLFGGGRNYRFVNNTAGRVAGNIQVDMSDGKLLGNLYGGGRMGLTGMHADGDSLVGASHGYITVNVSGGTIGRAIDTVTIGNVFGGGKGILEDGEGNEVMGYQSLGRVKATEVNISNNARIYGSVYGGGEIAKVSKNTNVTVSGGIIGSLLTSGGTTRRNGSVFGGGKGIAELTVTSLNDPAEVWGSSNVLITGGQVMENVYGGGELASVGQMVEDGDDVVQLNMNSVASVTITGGEIGPLDGTGNNGFVYGGGQGKGEDPSNDYILMGDVSNTSVVVSDSALVHASVYGGAAFGHVLGNTHVLVEKGLNTKDKTPLIGTDGMHGYDGNIFGGGQGDGSNFSNGRVGGNTTVEMTHGQVYGNIYGGGRLALTGVDVDGEMQSGTDHGNTKVMIKGGTVGNNNKTGTNPLDPDETVIETFTWFSMGNIYGGGKGYLDTDHPDQNDAEKSLLLGLTKNTTIEISDTLNNNTHVYGIVLGGGEIASVGSYELYKDPDHHDSITSVTVSDGGLATVRISGGIIGGDRSQMRYELEDPSDPDNFYLLYNDDLGYVYGGGEGWSADPADYDSVYTNGLDHPATSLIDLIATVQNTEVTITNDTTVSNAVSKPYVKASVFGGAESGHVMHDTKVTIAGGQIGAGTSKDANNHPIDLPMYTDEQFINPLTNPVTTTPTDNTLKGTFHWDYGHDYGGSTHYDPFDPVYIKNGYSGGTYTIYPSDGKSWFGNVFGGGSGWFPYQKETSLGSGVYESKWNPLSGKVWGNTEVNITGGHILNNVYGANESTDVSGKATIKMSGGTVGVPRTAAQVAEQPVICYVFGGGCGDPRDVLDGTTNAGSTDVQITGGIIYGSVFGGAEDGHVLGDVEVTIGEGDEFTVGEAPNAITYTYPVIGSTGTSGADGNLFGGGRNFLRENVEAGRVQGNINIDMDGGVFLGSIYGGGRQGLTGVDASGNNITDDPMLHGNVTIDISGGTVGNRSHVLTHTASSIGDVFGGGKGHDTNANLGRVKNTEVNISGEAKVLRNVYGGGELANVGWVTNPGGTAFDSEEGGLAKIEISGGQVGIEQIGTAQASIVGGNVFGGGYGMAGGKDKLPFANVDTTYVNIKGSAYITGSVFGGADNGHVWRNTSIVMEGGTVGQKNTLAELTVDANEQPTTDHIYTGSVLAGGRGITPEATSPAIVYNDTTGIVFGNATVSVTGGVVRHAVYGGGGLSHVGTFERNAAGAFTSFTKGKCTVTVAGTAHIGPTKEDLDALAGDDNAKKNTFFNMLGGNAGWVFGAGCGLAGHPDLTFCDSTLVTISGSAQVTGAAFGGGENGHVLDSTHIVISGGTIGGIPLHGTGSVTVSGGAFDEVSFNATTDELTEDIYGSGPRVFRGNVYGGGKGNDTIADPSDKLVYAPHSGQVYGKSKVEITGGTIYNRVFGGGLLASVGTFEYDTHTPDSIVGVVGTGPAKTGLAKVIISGGTIGTNGDNNGDVFGGGRGQVGRHWEPTYTTGDQVVNLAYVGSTEVIINDGATIKSNVFGGSGSGHVQENAHVVVNGGTIGSTYVENGVTKVHGGWHSNVYGGGGGQHQYQRTPTTTHFSITSGRVYGNTKVEIRGGDIKHNVYGGGAIASVGTYNIYATTMEGLFKPGTGDTEVTITGGTIGVDGDNNGMVFGSGRGQIDSIGAFMDSLSYAVNTVVNIGTQGSSDGPTVHGSVYGSGENGHVFKKATVNVYSGTIGCENYENDHASFFANHGNVYGAGCGTDMYDSDGNGSEDSYNPRSGIVQGNTEVNIKGGHISHNVYGGGAMALVGYYDVSTGGTPAEPGMWGDDIVGVTPFTGKTVVNVSGGTIGTASTTGHVVPDNVEHGNVYGGSRGPNSGDGFTNMALVDTSFVFISGDDTHVLGNVFGGGAKSLVRTARVATISGGTIGTDGLLNSSGVYNGYVFGGSQHGLDDIDSNPYTSLKTVNVRGGHIKGNVFGCSDDAVEGDPSVDVLYNPVWTSFVNITGGTIGQNVFGAGNNGIVHGSVCVNIGATAVKKAPTKETVNSEEVNMNKFMSISENGTPVVPAPDTTIVIGGSVYAGSQGGPNGWKQFDISQYAVVYIDGKGYDTKSETIPTVHTTDGPYMNIAGGLIGSGTHCESGSKGRQIVLKNYGHRNADKDDEFTSATRSLTTIQRCGHVLLDSTNVKLSGAYDITLTTTPTEQDRKYGVMKVDTAMYVYDGSGIVLGAANHPVYMDSIRVLKSVLLAEGTVYDSALLYKLRWDTIGIMNNDNKLHRIHNGSAIGNGLDPNYENVIIFNDTSRLWVRYTDKKAGDTKDTTYYGELQGFFRMRADGYNPKGSESFAYARPKITDRSGNENTYDGGFLSYQNAYNYFSDDGALFTKTKQYPYINVLGGTRFDRNDFRIWAYPSRGNVWYVDGRPTGSGDPGWGNDEMRKKENEAGLYPDKPKKTLFGMNGSHGVGVVTETYTGADAIYNYSYKNDQIYVVGALSEFDGAVLKDSIGAAPGKKRFPLRLYRYPGGHAMSNGETDEGNGSVPATWGGVEGSAGPGANYGALLDVPANTSIPIQLKGVVIDGLSNYTSDDENDHMIPASFDTTKVTMPLVITHSGSMLTLQDSTVLKRGYNNTDASGTDIDGQTNYYLNPDFASSTVHNGGALFVDAGATVNVCDTVFITGNKQKNGSGYVESNVFIPTFAAHLNIADTLSSITRIGVTKPRRNDESDYTYNTFSPVAVVTNSDHAADTARTAWRHNNFYDDMDMFFVNGYTNENQRSTYYSASIPDYPSSSTGLNPDKTLFFGWTWNNVVRSKPAGYVNSGSEKKVTVSSAEGLAWLISKVNKLNGQTTNFGDTTVLLTSDIDLKKYVWVPVGTEVGSADFAGNFDGQGHLIDSLCIDYIGTGDRRYEYDDYGLFGYVNNDTVDRTFVVSGIIRPEGKANIGGLVGRMVGASALVSNSEAAVKVHCAVTTDEDYAAGGLVGWMSNGEIRSSMAMSEFVASQFEAIGGLVGKAESAKVYNSFAIPKFTISDPATVKLGGLVGVLETGSVQNCYSNLQSSTSNKVTAANYGQLVHTNRAEVKNSYGFKPYGNVAPYSVEFPLVKVNSRGSQTACYYYDTVASSDTYGYLYLDNALYEKSGVKADTSMMVKLNEYVEAADGFGGDTTYARWTRPTIDGINGDLPVLLLSNFGTNPNTGLVDKNMPGLGGFRSLATYGGGPALQYGGPVRDASSTKGSGEIDEAIDRLASGDELLVYGDITYAPTKPTDWSTFTGRKIAIHEDAAILFPGSFGETGANVYVGVTFDNSSRHATDVYGNTLHRDWHMFSTPLANAPLGVNYNGENTPDGCRYDPWVGTDELPAYGFTGDGYFPTQVPEGYINTIDGFNYDMTKYIYPYDFYTWYEPRWQWINFKRNGPSHWHYDEEPGTNKHHHIDYKAAVDSTANLNETIFIPGKGYMMAIHDNTYMQSHGQLNAGEVKITLTNSTGQVLVDGDDEWETWVPGAYGYYGNNFVGNPFHAYLDFGDDSEGFGHDNGFTSYYTYDADAAKEGVDYLIYPGGGSLGGYYASQYLHPHQGFFLQTNDATKEITFSTTQIKGRKNAGISPFRNWRPAYPLVNLFAYDNEGRGDVVVIEFNRPENGGGKKAKALRNGNHLIYAHNGDTDYGAFFAVEGTERVPVRFMSLESEQKPYTLRWETHNGFFHSLYLIDNLLGITYDMLANDSYTFIGSKEDYVSRFVIVFNVTDVEEKEDFNTFAFFSGSGSLVVNGTGRLEVIDVTGRILYTEDLYNDQNHVNLSRYAKGVYTLRLWNSDKARIQKIVMY
jgi:hypothetical protein